MNLNITSTNREYLLVGPGELYFLANFKILIIYNRRLSFSVISWRSVLLVGETGEPDKTTDLSQVTDKLYHIISFVPHSDRDSNSQLW